MTLPSFEFVLGNTIIYCNLDEDLKNYLNDKIIRDVPKWKIKTYPRRDRPNKQYIYINNKYFMTIPSAVFNPDEDLKDPYNYYGNEFIYLIKELYKRGYDLNKIKTIINIIIKHYTSIYINPNY